MGGVGPIVGGFSMSGVAIGWGATVDSEAGATSVTPVARFFRRVNSAHNVPKADARAATPPTTPPTIAPTLVFLLWVVVIGFTVGDVPTGIVKLGSGMEKEPPGIENVGEGNDDPAALVVEPVPEKSGRP